MRRAVPIRSPVLGPVGGRRWFRLGVRPQLCAKSKLYAAVLSLLCPIHICSHVTDSLFPQTIVVKCDPGPGRAFVRVKGKISSLFWLQGNKEISCCQLQQRAPTCTSSVQMWEKRESINAIASPHFSLFLIFLSQIRLNDLGGHQVPQFIGKLEASANC